MYRRSPPLPERDSIYGDTYDGVPTPNTIIAHGYPTRFHGPVLTMPMLGGEYRSRPYARAPFLGVGDYPGHHQVHYEYASAVRGCGDDEAPARGVVPISMAVPATGPAPTVGMPAPETDDKNVTKLVVVGVVIAGGIWLLAR